MIFDGLRVKVFHFISRMAAERPASPARAQYRSGHRIASFSDIGMSNKLPEPDVGNQRGSAVTLDSSQ